MQYQIRQIYNSCKGSVPAYYITNEEHNFGCENCQIINDYSLKLRKNELMSLIIHSISNGW